MSNNNTRKKMRSKIGIIVVSIFLLYFGYTILSQQSALTSNQKQIAELEESIAEKRSELASLKSMAEFYGCDESVERIARDKLGLVRPDEKVFVDVTGK